MKNEKSFQGVFFVFLLLCSTFHVVDAFAKVVVEKEIY